MKRITWWPQLILGFTFNWGALMGWSAVHNTIGLPTIPLYIAGIFWTLAYDTIYAQQDVDDDARVGIKSSARLLGSAIVPWVGLFYAIALLFLMLTGVSAELGRSYFVVLTAAGVYIAVQLALWRTQDPANCLTRFRANRDIGLIILLAILAGKIL
jgi:4-hydroxybenzoate polyprenyltransferase